MWCAPFFVEKPCPLYKCNRKLQRSNMTGLIPKEKLIKINKVNAQLSYADDSKGASFDP
jgi:hypothetical protein